MDWGSNGGKIFPDTNWQAFCYYSYWEDKEQKEGYYHERIKRTNT